MLRAELEYAVERMTQFVTTSVSARPRQQFGKLVANRFYAASSVYRPISAHFGLFCRFDGNLARSLHYL